MTNDPQNSEVDWKQAHSQAIEQRNLVETLAEEYAILRRDGKPVSIEQYIEKHPDLATEIRELFPLVEILDQAVGSPGSERSSPPKDEIGAGTQLGEYQLIKPIGRGGMGVVYQAKHVVLGSKVAVKLLPAGMNRSKQRERFQREASAAARMHHSNIVRVFDYGIHGKTLYYVMELIEGCGLDHFISPARIVDKTADSKLSNQSNNEIGKTIHGQQRTQRLGKSYDDFVAAETELDLKSGSTVSQVSRDKLTTSGSGHDSLWHWVAKIGAQAADAIDYAHSVGVIHRDIKPSNLMIDAEENVYVMDFGLAKVVDDHSLTATGDILGTVRYMPPEGLAGRSDHRGDIYGLGLTLYELLTNQIAFQESDRANLMNAISEGKVEPLNKRLPAIPRDLNTIIQKALEVEPTARFQSASEFRDDLKRFIQNEPIEARRSTWIYRTSRWIARNRTVAALMAATVLSLAGGMVVSTMGWSRAIAAEADASELAQKEKKARQFAEAESRAKTLALREKQLAIKNEAREREHALAVANFVVEDFLAMTTVQGQSIYDLENPVLLGRDASLSTLLNRAATKLKERSDLSPSTRGELTKIVGQSLGYIGNFEEGVKLLKENVDLQHATFGVDSEETQSALSSLAAMYGTMGRYNDAINIWRPLIEVAPKKSVEDLQRLMTYKHSLAIALYGLREFQESLDLLRQIRQWRVNNLPPNHEEIHFCKSTIASCYFKMGNHDRAIELFEELVQEQTQLLPQGDRARQVQSDKASLAAVYAAEKRFEEAEDLLQQILDQSVEEMEPNHPEIQLARNNLGSVYIDQGKHDLALPLLEQALLGIDSTIGKDSLHSLMIAKNIGRLHHAKGDRRQALKAYQQVLERCELLFEENDPQVLSAKSTIAYNHWQLGNTDESIPLYESILEIRKHQVEGDEVQTIRTKLNLGVNYLDAKRFEESIDLLEEALKQIEGKHPSLLWVKDQLRVAYLRTGNREAMVKILNSQIPQVRKQREPESIQLANYLSLCVSDLFGVNEVDMAEPLLREIIAIRENKSEGVWQTNNTRLSLGRCLTEQAERMNSPSKSTARGKKLEEALSLFEQGYQEGIVDNAEKVSAELRAKRLSSTAKSFIKWAEVSGDEKVLAKWTELLKSLAQAP